MKARPRSFLLSLLAVPIAACGTSVSNAPSTENRRPVGVATAVAHEEPLPIVYRASGTVRSRNTATLTSKRNGSVRAVHVRAGDTVTAGQLLIELEANDVRATAGRARAGLEQSVEVRDEAESALEAARVAATLAQSTRDRSAALLADKAIPQQQYDDEEARWRGAVAQEKMAQAHLRAMASSIDEAKAALGEADAMLGYAQIVAPFAGRVLERRVDPGTLASPGTPLLVLADDGTLRVEVAVEESRAADVKVGDDASVDLEARGRPVTGKVSEIVPTVDVASRAFLVKIDLPSDVTGVRPGTFARVGFSVGTHAELVVPTTAITSFGALDRVFVVEGGGAHLRVVTRGETQGPWTEVLSGLSVDELVVASPPPAIFDGSPVEVRP